jgi:hypothetical protein
MSAKAGLWEYNTFEDFDEHLSRHIEVIFIIAFITWTLDIPRLVFVKVLSGVLYPGYFISYFHWILRLFHHRGLARGI